MSTFDKVAFGNRPSLYLSAPEVLDKSGTSLFTLGANNLDSTGQPIIYGSEFSFIVDSTRTVEVVGNPLFFNDTASFECVIVAPRPEDEVVIVSGDDVLDSLLLTPEGVTLRLNFESLFSTYTQSVTVPIKDWNKKFYIVLTVTSNQATLSVNGEAAMLTYTDTVIANTNLIIGGGLGTYTYLLDGVGFYNTTLSNKSKYINDLNNGHSNYVAHRHSGSTTRFEGHVAGKKESFTLNDFVYDNEIFTLIYYSPTVQGGTDYLIVRANDERVLVSYDIGLDTAGEFNEYLLIGSVEDATIRFMVNAQDVDNDFTLSVQPIRDGDIAYESPAKLVLSGLALYGEPSDSIVNYPDGTKLPGSAYTGTWIYSPTMPDNPESVELVFRPIDQATDTVIYASPEGSATFGPTGAITGFTAYLNGSLVTDLTSARVDQWNHLVLVKNRSVYSADFESSVDSWGGAGISPEPNPTVALSGLHAYTGSSSLQITWNNDTFPVAFRTISGLTVGKTYTARAKVWVEPEITQGVRLAISSTTYLGNYSMTHSRWEEISVTFTATATSHILTLRVYNSSQTPYLTGSEKTWMDSVRVAEAGSNVFYLNSPDGLADDSTVSYMYLSACGAPLTAQDAIRLYEIATGTDILILEEQVGISEGTFPDTGESFNAYAYTWSIVGAGGS